MPSSAQTFHPVESSGLWRRMGPTGSSVDGCLDARHARQPRCYQRAPPWFRWRSCCSGFSTATKSFSFLSQTAWGTRGRKRPAPALVNAYNASICTSTPDPDAPTGCAWPVATVTETMRRRAENSGSCARVRPLGNREDFEFGADAEPRLCRGDGRICPCCDGWRCRRAVERARSLRAGRDWAPD